MSTAEGLIKAPTFVSVTERIRDDIASSFLEPGTPLRVQELADRYNVSALPVREALQQLRGEGLVVFEHNKGARVRKLDIDSVAQIYGILEALGAYFAERFCETASPFQIAALERLEDQHELALTKDDNKAIIDANSAFHDFIIRACNNPAAGEVLWRQRMLLGTLRINVGYGEARRNAVSAEHREMIDAFRQGNKDQARRVAAFHSRSSKDDLVERLRGLSLRHA
jgi:DNA-binding GntR family transcriptional regulator